MTSSLSYLVGQPLVWMPTATFKSRYSLVAPDNTTLATLDMSGWKSKAHIVVPEGTLFIEREGWSGRKINVQASEQGPLLATYQRKWTGTSGTLTFPDGYAFTWKGINFWGNEKAWTDSTGTNPYIHFSTGSFSRKTTVTIHPQAADLPNLSLLVALGLYNIIVERNDAAAASSAATV
ncbi:hypothetical protein KDA_72540 [Dictyobacter alpinus]|uniref:Uncharacterized protein n=1 Tax=Dictyobacter alpinus TaxID=2014873 RepID=A0A402BKB9_9CHLR|nr:hypothetical protein [Dictyobacter alpinus]GCE31770.1 hypothetical protein KDA_72540 [Dictyobacter alpinus]